MKPHGSNAGSLAVFQASGLLHIVGCKVPGRIGLASDEWDTPNAFWWWQSLQRARLESGLQSLHTASIALLRIILHQSLSQVHPHHSGNQNDKE